MTTLSICHPEHTDTFIKFFYTPFCVWKVLQI